MSTPQDPSPDPLGQAGAYSASTDGHTGKPDAVVAAITEVTERVRGLVQEEVELAKAELQAKLRKLVTGIVVGAVAGLFIVGALLLILEGLAWLAYYIFPFPNQAFFWGFFIVAALLLLLGALAGFLASRAIRKATPPAPTMAIDEARLIKETVTASEAGAVPPPGAEVRR